MSRLGGVAGLRRAAGAALVAALVATAATSARADRFIPIGARQRGMGGAGVAASDDATSIYWNPANLSLLPLGSGSEPKKKDDAAKSEAAEAPHDDDSHSTDEEAKPREAPPEKAPDKWSGHSSIDLQLAFNMDLILTGDIITRLNRIDTFIQDADVDGAAQRASQLPPALSQQDFRNLIALYEELEDLDQGGDALWHVGGGAFARWKGFGLGLYTNTYAVVRPTTNLLGKSGFSASTDAGPFAQVLIDQGAPTTAPPAGGATVLRDALLAANIGLSTNQANAIANLAAQSGVDLEDPFLQEAIVTAATLAGNGTADSILNNDSGARVLALSTQELAVALSFDLWEEHLSIGIAPKLMHGITGEKNYLVADALAGNLTFDNAGEQFLDSREDSFAFGIDAGIAVQPFDWIRFGIVGRNLNRPGFKFKISRDRKYLNPQVRAGVALKPVPSLTLTMDADLIRNTDFAFHEIRSQLVGGGLEWAPGPDELGFALRLGAYSDVRDLREKKLLPVLTAGMGVRFAVLTVDVSANVGLEREEFRGNQIPRDIGFGVQVGFNF
jgi:hypothetical protein